MVVGRYFTLHGTHPSSLPSTVTAKVRCNSFSEQNHSPSVSRVPEHVALTRDLLLAALPLATVCLLLAGGGGRAAGCLDEPNAEETHSDTLLAFIMHKNILGVATIKKLKSTQLIIPGSSFEHCIADETVKDVLHDLPTLMMK